MSMCSELLSIYSDVGLSVHHCLNYAEAVTLYLGRAFFAAGSSCVCHLQENDAFWMRQVGGNGTQYDLDFIEWSQA